ncbi:MAG: TIGR03960 family B12-binding radical SAM protein [Planctomycetota bacterium]|nr:TIGR03960 family B12-binding radical SAM protein [Planctomycetota bacterium]
MQPNATTSDLGHRISNELLPFVRQPAQYIGREVNQLVREGDWEKADLRVAVAFPDAYTIGMSHLGCQIIYWLANHTAGVCAERVYSPWIDAEQIMRKRRIPLFTWDTRRPVSSADILAISLQYEMGFTNVLTLLDLAGIPLRAAQRDDSHPLVIAGGPQADNPEPMADFLDLVVIGDGEESMAAIMETFCELKAQGVGRRDMIEVMARKFPWIYAPNLYDVSYHDDGTIAGVMPRIPDLPAQIERCQTLDFENAPFPLRPLVPFSQVVHDRMAIEVMRGCPQRCRFCHAGYTKRPVGVRSVDKIVDIAEQQYRATGHKELGLLSLSTADYPHLKELAARVNERFADRHVNISMPSLRVDKMLRNIPWMANQVRKSGLTIAVEAASDRLRQAIRKKVTDGDLIEGITQAYKAGWSRIKCYFMAGFPGETEDDIRAIHTLSVEMSQARRALGKGPANINAAVGWLVPKPYTPFQWAAQPRLDYFENARRILNDMMRNTRGKHVRVKTHDPRRSILEGVFSRGDRRLARTIETAYKLGARFDGWDECFNYDIWLQAFDRTGIDPDWYAHRERDYSEILPWDHIRSGPKRDYLEQQYDDVFVKTDQPAPQPGVIPLPLAAGA